MHLLGSAGWVFLCLTACSSTTTNEGGSGAAAGGGGLGTGGSGLEAGPGGSGGSPVCTGPTPGAGGCALGTITNCAYCGHDCSNAKCTNGACEPGAVGTGPGFALALGPTHVFAHNDQAQQLLRVGRDSTDKVTPTVVATLTARPMRLVVDGDIVYVSQLGSIVRVPASGSGVSPETVTSHKNPDDRANDILIDGGYLYFVSNYSPAFRRFKLTGATAEETVSEAGQSVSLRGDESGFYFVEYGNGNDGKVRRLPREYLGKISQAETVVSGLAFPSDVELLGPDVYFSAGDKLYRIAKTATNQSPPSSMAQFAKEIRALTTDGCSIYVNEGGNDSEGKVWRVSADGSKKDLLASGHNLFGGDIAVTQAAVFFGGAGGVRRMMR